MAFVPPIFKLFKRNVSSIYRKQSAGPMNPPVPILQLQPLPEVIISFLHRPTVDQWHLQGPAPHPPDYSETNSRHHIIASIDTLVLSPQIAAF